MEGKKLYYALFGIIILYLIAALIGTQGQAIFAGDNTMHMSMAKELSDNPSILFSWHDICCGGSPAYMFYQPLPHIFLSILFLFRDTFAMYKFAIILLAMFMPVTMYYGVLRMKFSQRMAIMMSLLPLLISSYTGVGFEYTSIFGWGLFTQFFAMVLFPLTVGYLYSAIHEDKNLPHAILFVSLTMLSNAIIGFLTIPVAAIIVVLNTRRFWSRCLKFCEIMTASFVVLAFWALPILAQKPYYGGILKSETYLYSVGYINATLQYLSGRLLDMQHVFPLLTIFSLAGIIFVVMAIFKKRRDSISKWLYNKRALKERFILYGVIVGFILFAGGKWLHIFPLVSFLEMHRFLFLFQFFLMFAIAYACEVFMKRWEKTGVVIFVIIGVFMLASSVNAIYDRQTELNSFEPDILEQMSTVGMFLNQYPDARVLLQQENHKGMAGLLHLYTGKPLVDAPIESQASLSTQYIRNANIEDAFFWKYNIGYVVVNKSIYFDYPRYEVGEYYIYMIDGKGYFDIDAKCGTIVAETTDYTALVETSNSCGVIFKMTYNPEWYVYIDGVKQRVSLYDDSLIAFMVPAGEHEIVMKYERLWYRTPLFILGIALLAILFFFNKRTKKD